MPYPVKVESFMRSNEGRVEILRLIKVPRGMAGTNGLAGP